MIVWINGAFGSGKTTLAEELQQQLPGAMLFDPEYVGYVLVRWVPAPESGDFQDIPLWRKLVAEFAIGLRAEYHRTLIVPMTLVNPQYRDEIFGLLGKAGETIQEVFLDVPAAELNRRIDAQVLHESDPDADAKARAFRRGNVERCVQARADLPADTLVLTVGEQTPVELAELVLTAIGE